MDAAAAVGSAGVRDRRTIHPLQVSKSKCKKEKVCPHCAAINGVVKKVGCMRIIHERLRERAAATKQRAGSEHYEKARSEFRESFEEALRQPKGGFEVPALGGAELAELIKKAHDDLHPLRVRARKHSIV